ncbi:BamA/TamA family outer membrane protein [Tropicibacter sp. R16_0]|uniref:autotransporter assembly complex protein TamA n=1 Tax=Tropicibacter sp. R16_0 TaxID=2821102 RepID=UPI001ADAC4B7|nr:BamA/TamA family outer membrane protein [Tropicibacter sp. R16_0]MBO9451631.1 BamA/TamA family outer membrane protein [Tropicibacter sp. R16_0]
MRSSGRFGAVLRGMTLACGLCLPSMALAMETALVAPGASEDLTERLTSSSLALGAERHGLTEPIEVLSAALSDYRTLVQVLYDEGFFSPVVSVKLDGREAANIDPLRIPNQINRIDITVQTGPQFKFGKTEISPITPETELPEGYAPGQTATTGAIRDAASAGIVGWRDAGYAKAKVGDQRITARHRDAQLDSDIDLLPGPKLRFGKMHISGTSDVRHEALRRIAGFPTGEVYSPAGVQKVGTRLRRTGTFNSVTLRERDVPNPDGTLDFDAEFEDLPKRRLTFGVEVKSTAGLDLTATWMHRNVFNNANRFRFEANIRNIGGTEDIDGRVGFRLDQPDKLGPDDSIFYIGNLERRNRTHYKVTSAQLGVGARRTFSEQLYAEAWFGFNYASSDDAFGTDRRFRYLILPVRSEWDKRDNPVSATKGFYIDARFTPYAGLSGTESGARFFVDGRGYWDVTSNGGIILAGRLQLGSVVGSSQAGTSPELLFYSGGAGTVRGQPYESLGTPVGTGIAGGRSFLGVSAEVRGRVTEKISLVGFYDIGLIDAKSFVTSNSSRHAGAGLGVRYDLGGFGPLRVDLALPVEGSTGDGLQFYIGIGQAF